MRTAARRAPPASRARERGQAALLVALLISLGIFLFVYNAIGSVAISARHGTRTEQALAQAKEALIGRAASDNVRPGSLPCPDINNDGSAESPVLYPGGVCPSYIGRLPWRTLGLPELRDGSGELLWYALSPLFRDHSLAEPINSDKKGNITVYSGDTSTVITAEAVAVVFAAGGAVGTQLRNAAQIALCPTTGTLVPTTDCAANYLESASGVNNANATGPYIAAQPSASFNDRLLVITAADLMPLVETRVARELLSLLRQYKANSLCNCYPWADISDGNSDAPPLNPSEARNRGRVPWNIALPEAWGSNLNPLTPPIPAFPTWLINNQWTRLIHYAAGRNYLQAGGAACTSCTDPTLRVNGVAGYEVVLLTPGPAGTGRPVAYPWTNWAPYLEDAENSDNGNDRFVTPASQSYARDRIFTIP